MHHLFHCISPEEPALWVAAHLARDVFRKYPYADIYTPRQISKKQDNPGDIIICGDGVEKRYIIALLGQFYPGSPRYPSSKKDGYIARERYFKEGLDKIAQIEELDSIAFPWGIGCGAAGGNWDSYLKMINDFAERVEANVLVVKL